MGLVYPSMVVHLRLRFDEAFSVVVPPPGKSPRDFVDNPRPPANGDFQIEPLVIQGAEDPFSLIANRIPKKASVELPGYRQAGKWSMTFDWRDLPVDMRLVRSCGIEIHLGAVDSWDFGLGMVRAESDGSRRSILNTVNDFGSSREDTLLLVGIADSWVVEHESGSSTVSMEGRDLRGILLDSPIGALALGSLDLTQQIQDVVRQILALHPFGARFLVYIDAGEWGGPASIPAPAEKDGLTRVQLTAKKNKKGGKPKAQSTGDTSKMNFWDIITQYCFLVGAIPSFVGERLWIRPARNVFDLRARAGFDPTVPTPFEEGATRIVDGEEINVRRLVYGRDVQKLKFERKLGGVKARVVEVVSLDTSSAEVGEQKILTATYPTPPDPPASKKTSVAPSGDASSKDTLRIPVAGIKDQKRLQEIAQAIFEEVGRGELGGSCSTKSLFSFGGDNADPDMLRLRPGDAMEFAVDARALSSNAPLVSQLTSDTRRSFSEQVNELFERLGDMNLARVIVATARGAVVDLQRFFRVSNVKYDWSATGVEIAFDFQNYIEQRSQVQPAPVLPATDAEGNVITLSV